MENQKKRKTIKIIVSILAILIVTGFLLNWFLTYSLEDTLKRKLRDEVSKATDGFYDFSYDKLTIGLFSGELSIQGVELIPDSLVFEQWKNGDSLPDIYFKVHLEEIHFKGLNLTWQKDYRNLAFSLFEIKTPDVKVYQPLNSRVEQPSDSQPTKQPKTLYEMISMYINVLSVERIKLQDANIFYTIEDTISPITYALRDANLNAYRFRLDKDSYSSGKLLYSDGFEFEAEKPQQLLHSKELILNTANIRLSTLDELVKIEGVHLHPSKDYWEDRAEKTGGYIDAEIRSVIIKGIKFKREQTLNYLDADSFNISSTDIKYLSVKKDGLPQQSDNVQSDTVNDQQVWSLYSFVSPIFQQVAIGKIGIEKTKFNYTLTQNGKTDVYSLDQFDFHANNFLLNSMSEKQMKFWFVDNFNLSASNIEGLVESNNSDVKVATLSLDTENKHFNISDITVKPIVTTNVSKDYYSGDIKSIDITGLNYDTGISALQLKIESPNIEYFRVSDNTNNSDNNLERDSLVISEDLFSIFNPYADYLSVKNINLSGANVTLHDLKTKESYQIKDMNFYALRFLIDENTRKNQRYLFTCDDVGLSFKDFDNLLPGGDYRLKIKNTNISTLTGLLLLQNVQLIPQKKSWVKPPDTYYSINVPLLKITGFNNDSFIDNEIVKVKSLTLNSPQIEIIKTSHSTKNNGSRDISHNELFSRIKSLTIDTVDIKKVSLDYFDLIKGDSLQASLQAFRLHALEWNTHRNLTVNEFVVESPEINLLSQQKQAHEEHHTQAHNQLFKLFGDSVAIRKFIVSSGKFNIQKPDSKVKLGLETFAISDFSWNKKSEKSNLHIASFDIQKPILDVNKNYYRKDIDTKPEKKNGKDVYSIFAPYADQLSINHFNLTDAHVSLTHSLDASQQENRTLNTTNLDISGLSLNVKEHKMNMDDINFNTKDLYFPIMNGLYTIGIDEVDISKKRSSFALSGVKMISAYPKMDFAYMNPTHMDWFDVVTGDIVFSGVDYESYFSDNIIKAKHLVVKDVMLQNMKNKKIYTPPKMQPLIYTKLYDLPFGIFVDTTDVFNFSVVYEELPKKGSTLGVISFMGMNAKINGLTNMASYPQQFMRLDANGMLMGKGYFTATWDMPASPDYDCFILAGHVHRFDLRDLNQIVTPLGNAEVKSGILNDLKFKTEASSKDASVDMTFLYNDLQVNVFKGNGKEGTNKFVTNIANALIRSNNPNKKGKKPREAYAYIERDPYHSTFNYFWQILQPPLVESVGISQKQQNFAKKVAGFFAKVKGFFSGGKDKKEHKEDETLKKD